MAMDHDTLMAFMQVADHLGIDIVTHGYVPPDDDDDDYGRAGPARAGDDLPLPGWTTVLSDPAKVAPKLVTLTGLAGDDDDAAASVCQCACGIHVGNDDGRCIG